MQLSNDFLASYANIQPPFGPVGEVTYKRTYARPITVDGVDRKEHWVETQARVVNSLQELSGNCMSVSEMEEMFDHNFMLRSTISGRGLWQLGTNTVKELGGASLNACWHVPMDSLSSFCFIFDMMMLGGGVGLNIQREYVYQLPRLKAEPQRVVHVDDMGAADFIVPDSREGWIQLLWSVLNHYFDDGNQLGYLPNKTPFSYSTAAIRRKGAPIKGFGGVASGSQALIEGIANICKVLDDRIGKRLRPIDVLDVSDIIGSIVVAGNVRRAAIIVLGDTDDFQFLDAKRWDLGNIPNWRAMSNNTVVCNNFDHLQERFWEGYEGNGEPYGMMNLSLCRTMGRLIDPPMDDSLATGTNPCVTADTWVDTQHGYRQVKDLVDTKFAAVVAGNANWTDDRGFYSQGVKDVFTLQTADGISLKMTGNHRVLLSGGDALDANDWVEAQNLKPGDKLQLNTGVYRESARVANDTNEFYEGYVLGNLIGDGTIAPNGTTSLATWKSDEGSDEVAAQLLGTVTGWSTRTNVAWNLSTGKDQQRLTDASVRDKAASYGIVYGDKVITPEVEAASNEVIRGMLSGYFDADGHVEGESTGGGISVRLSSSTPGNLESVQRLLLRWGIKSVVRAMKPAGWREMPGGTYFCQESQRLIITGKYAQRFQEVIGFVNPVKRAKLADRLTAMTRAPYAKRMETVVLSVTPAGQEEVFDCTIDRDLNPTAPQAFGANGLIAHNCGEITLEPFESCNLAECFAPNIKNAEELTQVLLSMYRMTKIVSSLPLHWAQAAAVLEKNRRLGLSITGIMQASELLTEEALDTAYRAIREYDVQFSKRLSVALGREIKPSLKISCVKPSGTVSLLAGVSAGVHPELANQFIRRIRMASNDDLVQKCADAGYAVEYARRFDGTDDRDTKIVSFPVKSRGGPIADDVSAIEQLEMAKRMQTYWSDNQVSCTAYYTPEELPLIKDWLKTHYTDGMKGISFLLKSEHGFDQAPIEPITESEYEELMGNLTYLDLSEDLGEDLAIQDCSTGACPIK